MSFNRWVNKQTVAYLYNGILLGNEKEQTVICNTWMDLKDIMLSESSQS